MCYPYTRWRVMIYLLIGIIIGMIIMALIDALKKANQEKQYFEEYKEIIGQCLKEDNIEEIKKKRNWNKIRKDTKHWRWYNF